MNFGLLFKICVFMGANPPSPRICNPFGCLGEETLILNYSGWNILRDGTMSRER